MIICISKKLAILLFLWSILGVNKVFNNGCSIPMQENHLLVEAYFGCGLCVCLKKQLLVIIEASVGVGIIL